MRRACLLPLLLAACDLLPQPKKTYSSDIGVTPVPLEEGQLAGTWVGQLEFATVVDTGVVGERNAGANGGRVITITWNADSGTYTMDLRWCWDDIFEVEGQKSTFTEETLHALRPVILNMHVDHAGGTLDTDVIPDVWGVQNLPDPFNTPLPNKDDYQSEPQSTWMLDEDGDGKPGVTVHLETSFGQGEGYIVNRSIWKLHGVARSVDELVGLVQTERLQQNLLDSTLVVAGKNYAGETKQRPDENPKASWFQMIRARDGATCEDAKAARADGRLPATRPF
ncbi:MAG: hypothetical protein AB2A00_24640 [Myxococcota bacterium]